MHMLNPQAIKKDFPIFKHHPDLVYLDSAATALKPKVVIDKIVEYYTRYSTNIHRGVYQLSEQATQEYETSRQAVADFIGAKDKDEIIFTRNATESINLVAYALGRQLVGQNDEIVTTVMEHHSNFVPWQILASENDAVFKVIDMDDIGNLKIKNENGDIDLEGIIKKRTKIFALTYVSNVLGTVNSISEIVRAARSINPQITIVVDATKAVPAKKIDVNLLAADFLVFSAHKILGPTGVGILWGKKDRLLQMFPFNYGGGMIQEVSIEKTTFKEPPHKFEAGTPDIAGIIALKQTIKYILKVGIDNIQKHQESLTSYAVKRLKEAFEDEITIYGPQTPPHLSGIVSFNFKNYHPHDIAQILDEYDIAIRAGHHCAMPLHKRLGTTATARASFYIYNDQRDVEKLIAGLKKVKKTLG